MSPTTAAVLAHEAVGPSELLSDWHPDPVILATLAMLAVAYRQGLASQRRSRRRRALAGANERGRPRSMEAGRTATPARRPEPGPTQMTAFAGGVLALAVALVSPLDGAAGALFSAHMVQHLLLIVVAPPLLVAGRTGQVVMWSLPSQVRRRVRRTAVRRPVRRVLGLAWHPAVVWGSGTAVLWVWHLPVPYQAAVRHDVVHALEHATLVATAVLLWAAVLHRGRHALAVPVGVLLLFATGLQGAALGAVLAFAQAPLYPVHEAGVALWGLTLLEDQQLAGGLMWVPPGLVYLAVIGALVIRWFATLDTPGAQVALGAIAKESP